MRKDAKTRDRDTALFRRMVGKVTRLPQSRIEPIRPRPVPVPLQSVQEDLAVLAEMAGGGTDPAQPETGEELAYRGPGLQERQFRKLRRGQFAVEAELDLHGMTAESAQAAVAGFLSRSRLAGKRCVRIIHGKGRGSRGGRPVLKMRLQDWLRRRRDVLGFCSARAMDGGTGALYVLITRAT